MKSGFYDILHRTLTHQNITMLHKNQTTTK